MSELRKTRRVVETCEFNLNDSSLDKSKTEVKQNAKTRRATVKKTPQVRLKMENKTTPQPSENNNQKERLRYHNMRKSVNIPLNSFKTTDYTEIYKNDTQHKNAIVSV